MSLNVHLCPFCLVYPYNFIFLGEVVSCFFIFAQGQNSLDNQQGNNISDCLLTQHFNSMVREPLDQYRPDEQVSYQFFIFLQFHEFYIGLRIQLQKCLSKAKIPKNKAIKRPYNLLNQIRLTSYDITSQQFPIEAVLLEQHAFYNHFLHQFKDLDVYVFFGFIIRLEQLLGVSLAFKVHVYTLFIQICKKFITICDGLWPISSAQLNFIDISSQTSRRLTSNQLIAQINPLMCSFFQIIIFRMENMPFKQVFWPWFYNCCLRDPKQCQTSFRIIQTQHLQALLSSFSFLKRNNILKMNFKTTFEGSGTTIKSFWKLLRCFGFRRDVHIIYYKNTPQYKDNHQKSACLDIFLPTFLYQVDFIETSYNWKHLKIITSCSSMQDLKQKPNMLNYSHIWISQKVTKQSIAQNKKQLLNRSGGFFTQAGINPSSSFQVFIFGDHADPFRGQYRTHTDVSYEVRCGDSKKKAKFLESKKLDLSQLTLDVRDVFGEALRGVVVEDVLFIDVIPASLVIYESNYVIEYSFNTIYVTYVLPHSDYSLLYNTLGLIIAVEK